MTALSVRDLLVGTAAWSQSHGLSLAIRHSGTGWIAAFLDRDGRAVVEAESTHLEDALAELYTAAQITRAVAV